MDIFISSTFPWHQDVKPLKLFMSSFMLAQANGSFPKGHGWLHLFQQWFSPGPHKTSDFNVVLELIIDLQMWTMNITSKAEDIESCCLYHYEFVRKRFPSFIFSTETNNNLHFLTDLLWLPVRWLAILSAVMRIYFKGWKTKAQRGKEIRPKSELESGRAARVQRQAACALSSVVCCLLTSSNKYRLFLKNLEWFMMKEGEKNNSKANN